VITRLLKCILVFSVGIWGTLVALDNILDYDSNWQFVRHVLAMDTVFPDNVLKYRAVTDVSLQKAAYWGIIATEWLIGVGCLAGSWRLVRARRSARAFSAAKPLAASALVLVFLLYYVGFVMIGGEWFSMWQSQVWNGQSKATMFLSCAMFVLIVLLLPESDDGVSN
jgi:predicted small integral membrane protein